LRNNLKVAIAICFVLGSLGLWGQIDPIPNLNVQPLPLPGGDIIPGYGLFHQFFPGPPGQTPPFDPINADPHGITNFRGVTAMGYTLGTATDKKGNAYAVITDIRVYKGQYLEAKPSISSIPQATLNRNWRAAPSSKYELTSGTSV